MKTIHLFSLLIWGVLGLCLLPVKGMTAENADSKLSSDLDETADKASQEASMQEQQAPNSNQELLFGKITDLQINEKKSTLTLDKPEVGSEPAGTPLVEKKMEVVLDKDTQISDGNNTLTLADLKIGQHVRIMCEKSWFGKPTVQSIVIQR